MRSSALGLSVIVWTARLLALGLFLLWGAFFVEHVREWFLNPPKGFPPVWVWLQMLAHLAFLMRSCGTLEMGARREPVDHRRRPWPSSAVWRSWR